MNGRRSRTNWIDRNLKGHRLKEMNKESKPLEAIGK